MISRDPDDNTVYRVAVNHEGQYSIWPADRELPHGWKDEGKHGTKSECLDHIEGIWTDMRPISLRMYLEEIARRVEEPGAAEPAESSPDDELVSRLCEGSHPVEVSMRSQRTPQGFLGTIERDHVRVKFTDTATGTELGMRLDREATRLDGADFVHGTGTVHLVGTLTLDFVPVQCVADIELPALSGIGYLRRITQR